MAGCCPYDPYDPYGPFDRPANHRFRPARSAASVRCIQRPLSRRVLVVLSVRPEGWCMYIDAVDGKDHDKEWQAVAHQGVKLHERVAIVIARDLWGLEPGKAEYVR